MIRTRTILALCFVLAIGATAGHAGEQRGTYTENKRWGFKIRAPKKWKSRVIRLDERWIAGKFFPDYSLRYQNEQKELVEHKPDLWVIGFPHDREEERVKVDKPDEHTTIIKITNPYKDYKDFVKRESWAATGQGGWYYEREEEIEHRGFPVSIYEIKVEKLVRAPLRIVTWVYHCEDVDFAVQLRILEAHYAPNRQTIEGVMKSFRTIQRTEEFPEGEDEEDDETALFPGMEDPKRLTLDQINSERKRKVDARIQRELDNLPKDWRARKSKHFVILGPKDKRYTMPMTYVINFAEELRKYLEKHFSDIGPAEVPRGLIRVFKSNADEQAYQQGTRGWWVDEVGEITMTYSAETSLLGEFSWVARRLTDQYFHIKNENLRWGMPGWIRTGIWGHVSWARPSKRKKMILAPSRFDVIEVRKMLAGVGEVSAYPLKSLMTVSSEDVASSHHAQARHVVYWLLNRGNKGKVKGGIARYLKALETIIKEEDEKFEQTEKVRMVAEARAAPAAGRKKTDAELEKEEDEAFKKRRQNRGSFNEGLKSKYEAIRERAQEAAFGDLDDDDWEKLDRKWKKFAKN